MHVCNEQLQLHVLFCLLGSSTYPTALIITPWNATSALLSWQPPMNNTNCSFMYAINITGSSVTETKRIDVTSLSITNLNAEEDYYFAVAVEDAKFNKGPWSEAISVLWNGTCMCNCLLISVPVNCNSSVPQAVMNLTVVTAHSNTIEANWRVRLCVWLMNVFSHF